MNCMYELTLDISGNFVYDNSESNYFHFTTVCSSNQLLDTLGGFKSSKSIKKNKRFVVMES